MPPKLFLFDLDGTLLLSGGAGMRAMEQVFMDVYQLPDAFTGITPDGKIDPGIFREIIALRKVQVPDIDEAIGMLCERYIEALKKEMPVSPTAKIMPGVPALLDRLSAVPDVFLGLVTGNLEQGARIKLGRYDLNRYFDFGAYGSDHEDRAQLVRIAVRRAEKKLGTTIPIGRNIFVLGDTPRDVECGLANHTSTVGVATANFTREQLLEAGAHFVFDDFTDTDRVIEQLLGVSDH